MRNAPALHGRDHLPGGADPILGLPGGLIFTTLLESDDAPITIPDIPQTFRDLEIICAARTDRNTAPDAVMLRFNGDSSSFYQWQQASYGSGGTWAISFFTAQSAIWLGECADDTATAKSFGTLQAVIAAYALDNHYKNVTSQFSDHKFTDGVAGLVGAQYQVDDPITQIDLFPAAGTNFKAGSQFSLYGR